MDRRTLIGIALALGLYWAWLTWVRSSAPPVEEGAEVVQVDGDVDSDPESLPAGTTGARSPRGGRALP